MLISSCKQHRTRQGGLRVEDTPTSRSQASATSITHVGTPGEMVWASSIWSSRGDGKGVAQIQEFQVLRDGRVSVAKHQEDLRAGLKEPSRAGAPSGTCLSPGRGDAPLASGTHCLQERSQGEIKEKEHHSIKQTSVRSDQEQCGPADP